MSGLRELFRVCVRSRHEHCRPYEAAFAFCPRSLGTSPTEDLCPLLEAGRDGPAVFIFCFGAAQPDAWIAPSPMRLILSMLAF